MPVVNIEDIVRWITKTRDFFFDSSTGSYNTARESHFCHFVFAAPHSAVKVIVWYKDDVSERDYDCRRQDLEQLIAFFSLKTAWQADIIAQTVETWT